MIQRNGPMWTKADLANHGMGNMKPKQGTCFLGLRAVFCILATLCEAHCWSEDKNTTTLQKKACKVVQFAFSQAYGKIHNFFTKIRSNFFTFFSLFIFGFPLWFLPIKRFTQANILKSWTFAPGFLEYFSAIFSRDFLLGRWTQTPCCTVGKTNKLQWWGKTISTQNWLDKMCILENYVV